MATQSKKFTLNIGDWGKGFIMAILGVLLSSIYELIQNNGEFNHDSLKTIGLSALGAGIAYLIKNFFSTSTGTVLGKERK